MLQAASVGSSSEVVFYLKLAEHPGNAGIIQKMQAATAKLQNEMLGGGGSGGGAPGGIARSGPSAADTIAMNQRLQKKSVTEMVRDHNNAQKEMRKSVIDNIKASREAREAATKAESQGYQRQAAERIERMKAVAAQEVRAQAMIRAEAERTTAARKVSFDKAVTGANMAAQGVVNLARSYMILGISSEENLEKAVRAFAKFEAVVHGGMGLANIARGGAGLLSAVGIGVSGAAVGGATALLGGLVAGGAGLAYGFDLAAGGSEVRRRQQENGRLAAWQQARANAQEVPFKDPFDSNFRSVTRRPFGPSSDRDQLAASETRVAGLRNLEFEERAMVSMNSKWSGGEDQAVISAERLVELNRRIGDEYRDRYDTVLRLQQHEREIGERSLEVSRRVTQEFENRLQMAESRRDAAVSNRDEAGLRYADANARDRARIQAVAAKIQRGEELNPKERALASQYGLREQANESARRQNARERLGSTSLGQVLQSGVDTAQAGVTAAAGLVQASQQAEQVMRDELERRMAARYKKQLEDIADVIMQSEDRQPELAEVVKQRRAAKAVADAAAKGAGG